MIHTLCFRAAIAAFIGGSAITQATAADRYRDHFVARVSVANQAEAQQVKALEGDIWAQDPIGGTIDVMLPPVRRAELDALGLAYTIIISDVQQRIDDQHVGQGRTWYTAYHEYDEIVAYLNQLASAYPALAEMIAIGTTIEGRTIWGLRIAAPDLPPLSPGVFYWADVHAREWITTTVPQYVADHVLANYGVDPDVTDLVNHVELFLVPVANPDGYVFSWLPDERLWRKNRRDSGDGHFGVDINRNWGFGWGSDNGSSGYPSSGTYRGPAPFSEPETCALRDMFLTHPNIRAHNDIHSYSQLILYPWGFTPELPPDYDAYDAMAATMHQLIAAVHGLSYTYGPTYTTIYSVSGDSCDWTYGVRGVWAFSFELRDTGAYGFLLPPDQIIPNNEEILPALLHLANSHLVRATRISVVEPLPERFVAGEATSLQLAITSGDELLDPATAAVHYRYDAAGPFASLPLVQGVGAAFEVTLPATNCSSTPEYYFSVTGDAGTTTWPADAPASTHTARMVSGRTTLNESLDVDPQWSTEGLWAWGVPSGEGGAHGEPDPEAGYTGTNVYGYNLSGDYEMSMPERHLTTSPIDCTGQFGLRLSFWRWLGVEQPPYDHAKLSISNNGADWTILWQNTTAITDEEWTCQDFDIAAYADDQPAVWLRWTMGPTDSGWAYCGWNIDDVQIYATGCVGLPGDFDGDRILGPTDFIALAECLTGPATQIGPGCAVFDFQGDDDADLEDFADFQRAAQTP